MSGATIDRILAGAEDRWQVLDWTHRLHAAIPGSRLTVIEEAGRFCMEDRPEAVAAAILDGLGAGA